VPVPRGLAETLVPKSRALTSNPELYDQYKMWEASRSTFLGGLASKDPEAIKRGWQKDYFQGKNLAGGTFDGHQTRIDLKEFDPE
jgi:hypothetical protein